MFEKYESTPIVTRKKHAFSRIFLEVTLVVIFVFIMTYSPGKNSRLNDPLKISSKKNGTGNGIDMEHTTIKVTPEGFIIDGKLLEHDEITAYLENQGFDLPVLRIEPADAIHENLRWLLNSAKKSHEIELAL